MIRKNIAYLLMTFSLTFLCTGCLPKKNEQVIEPENKSPEK